MITEEAYRQYIRDFNGACAGTGMSHAEFYDKWYEPDATFEYIPKAAINSGKRSAVAFWTGVKEIMEETIRDHTRFVASGRQIATEAPIDFLCKRDLEWVGVRYAAGASFRLMMAAFYDVSPAGRISYARVYSIYNPHYQPA
ncbi:MAG: hypothetical protein KDJ78_05930 [Rhodobacteraceae bacterium]|uniref:hypothetical protein n=1 Tax=Amaricoccus sp. TaxID=1872485 RepID=UPI001DDC4C58|nr:hypothetical protein [Amaricoccus sp.]MCB1373704.1 hypothetical protein [Paracoccaceae bacterium]MCB1403862.1 hypothetical protein [Paracoccaceae bacterium]MCC0067346.1 hypothetical protein [Rhodovulum sp.]HRW16490.1 hypothetical protein [Amaricoccus sp.]